jgi:hypothetical protein
MRLPIGISAAALMLLVMCCGANADSVFTAGNRNVEALGEAGSFMVSELAQVYGLSPSTLTYAGSFTDTSWHMDLDGTYAGQAVHFELKTDPILHPTTPAGGIYTETGTVGADTWVGGGSWTFANVDDFTLNMGWLSGDEVTFGGPPHPHHGHHPDRDVVDKEWHEDQDGDRIDTGHYFHTEDGEHVGDEKEEHSHEDAPIRGRSSFRINLSGDSVELNLLNDYSSGSSAGTITTTPLPSTASVGGILLAVVFASHRFHRGRRGRKCIAIA